jgi:hypothetical protein
MVRRSGRPAIPIVHERPPFRSIIIYGVLAISGLSLDSLPESRRYMRNTNQMTVYMYVKTIVPVR